MRMNKNLYDYLIILVDKMEAINRQDYQGAADLRDKERQLIDLYGWKENEIKKLYFSDYIDIDSNDIYGKYIHLKNDTESIKQYKKIIKSYFRSSKIKKIYKNEID